MTCIVGYVENDIVHMAGDSCGSNGHNYTIYPTEKIFTVQDRFLIGCTTSYRLIDILQYSFDPPILSENYNPDNYMRKDFINSLRVCLSDAGYLEKECGVETGGNFLVGFDGHLFEVQHDMSVLTCPSWGGAVGSGDEAALAVLHHLRNKKTPAQARLRHALEAAEGTIVSVKSPFHFMKQEPLGWKAPIKEGDK